MTECADPSFGLRSQALAILQLLSQVEPEFADWDDTHNTYRVTLNTFPWYNGREKGVAITVQKPDFDPCLIITFGENSISDHVFVEHWVDERPPPNGPRIDDMPEKTVRREFPRRQYAAVVDYILDTMAYFYSRVDLKEEPLRQAHNVIPLFGGPENTP